jgi:hypothetical protein
VNEFAEGDMGPEGESPDALRPYILMAAALVVVIVIAIILIVTVGLPAFRGESQETAVADADTSATMVPTSTPSPTPEPTPVPSPSPWPTMPALVMSDTDDPAFEFVSAGGRPGVEWSGFFGQVLDADGQPLPGVPVVVWAEDGQPAVPPVRTDGNGDYEIRLAEAPCAGNWTIQVLTVEGQPASKLFTFRTDENSEIGIQQIQVLWKQMPQ